MTTDAGDHMDKFDCLLARLPVLPAFFLVLLIPAVISKPIALVPIGIGVFLIWLVFKFLW